MTWNSGLGLRLLKIIITDFLYKYNCKFSILLEGLFQSQIGDLSDSGLEATKTHHTR